MSITAAFALVERYNLACHRLSLSGSGARSRAYRKTWKRLLSARRRLHAAQMTALRQ